jgi:DedD protein
MSLDSLFKQNNNKKNDDDFSENVSGEFRSRSEEESLAAADSSAPGRSKSTKTTKRSNSNTRKSSSDDAALPEKKRARRRLIGAVALVLAAIIGLPMVFDSEPKPGTVKIAIEIPAKDGEQGTTQLAPETNNAVLREQTPRSDSKLAVNTGINQGIDKSEEIISAPTPQVAPASVDKTVKDDRAITKVDANTKAPTLASEKITDKNSDKKTELAAGNKTATSNQVLTANKMAPEPLKKTEAKVEPKAEAKKETIDDAARALALLEGRSLPETEKLVAKPSKTEISTGSFVVQVAALNSPAKVRELQAKLKAANIQSYTQKIITKTGEVSRIRVGPFTSKADAEKMRAKLVKIGLSGSLIPA